MIEVDLHGQPVAVDLVDRGRLLDLAAESEVQERISARRKFRYARRWCELNPVRQGDDPAGAGEGLNPRYGGDCDEPIAGPGAPLVRAGAPTELGVALGITTQSAVALMGDVLEAAYRLTRIWQRMEDLEVAPWKVRQVARWTKVLPPEGAAYVDRELAPVIDKVGLPTITRKVNDAIAAWRSDLLKEKEAKGKEAWHVTFDSGATSDSAWDGTSSLDAMADTGDLAEFADLIARIAVALGKQGDPDTLDQRRAKAIGVIARDEYHRLLSSHPVTDDEAEEAKASRDDGGEFAAELARVAKAQSHARRDHPAHGRNPDPRTGPQPAPKGARLPKPRRSNHPNTLYVHTTLADLIAHLQGQGMPLGNVERLGPATLDLIRAWVGKGTIRIQPVIDVNRPDAVDQHNPPLWMREAVILRDRHCVFPWCNTDGRLCDQDHIVPYLPHGPPGQTSIEKLACLCRTHHNAKTHQGWRYYRLPDGKYDWTSPTGRRCIVDVDTGTISLD